MAQSQPGGPPWGDDDEGDDDINKPVITQSNPSSFRKVISSLLVSSSFIPLPTLKKQTRESMAFDEAPSSAKKRKVVVVGGGIGGALLAKSLQFHSDLVLIDPKEYFEITWASLRSIVEPSVAERSVFKHSEYLTNGRLIISSAVSITDTEVLTSEGHLIPYDYLIIATGHRDNVPKTRSERLGQYLADNQKIKSAKSVLVIGGGPTGVEFAAEIAVDFPDKKVTLVHNRSRLLDFVGQKASRKTLDWFSSKKVEVILDQAVKLDSYSDETKTYQTSRGETVQADCHFLCTGRPLASAWLKETILKDTLDGRGRLMVDEHLRVKGQKNIFAIGDITDIPEMKQGYLAQRHALLAAKNLKVLMAGGKESKMSTYKIGSSIAIISLGRKDAVAQFPFTTVVGCLPGYVKSKDLFVSKTRKQMGVESRGGSGSGHSDGES